MANTPNLDLNLPIVGETLGPEYAELNNVAFETIDAHDHTASKGVAVPTAGLNINANLPLNGFAVTEANALSLVDVVGTPEELSVYSDAGDLYFRNASGTVVQITTGNTIVGTVGAISGLGDGGSSASFSDLSEDFSWFYEGARLAAFNVGDIRLYPFDGLNSPAGTTYTNFITLKSPTTLVSDYELTLPTGLPASSSRLVQVDSTGQLSYTNTVAESLTLSSPVLGASGTASLPGLSFSADPDTGMYISGTNSLSFATAGVQRLEIGTSAIDSTIRLRGPQGTPTAPTFSFTTDPTSGIYLSGAGTMNFTISGVARLSLNSLGFTSTLPFAGTTGSFSGAVSASSYGAVNATTLNTGGGAYKVTIYTGSKASGDLSLTPSGATAVYGAHGWAQRTAGSSWQTIDLTSSGASDIYFVPGGTANSVVINNKTGTTLPYRVVVFHN